MQHELATRRAGVGGGNRDLDAEFVGRAGLAFADAFDLRGMEGIQLPAALALLLRTDLAGAGKRPLECPLQGRLASYLAADVADDAAKPRAQDAQLPAMAVELLGVNVNWLPFLTPKDRSNIPFHFSPKSLRICAQGLSGLNTFDFWKSYFSPLSKLCLY